MSAGTKIFLTVFALIVGVLVVYYGVLVPPEGPSPAIVGTTSPVPQLTHREPEAPPLGAVTPPPLVVVDDRPAKIEEIAPQPEPTLVVPQQPPAAEVEDAMALGPVQEPSFVGPLVVEQASDPITDDALNGTHYAVSESQPLVAEPEPEPEPALRLNEAVALPQVQPEVRERPASVSKPASPANWTEYVVKSGDTMVLIAQEWFGDGSKWTLIAKANPLVDPTRMRIGQTLRLPPKDAALRPDPQAGRIPLPPGPGRTTYIVRSGDTLAKIAREQFGDYNMWKTIYNLNRSVIGNDPASLKPGMKLTLPPKPTATG